MSELNSYRKIKSIKILSTGTGEVHPEHQAGSSMPQLWWVLFSQSWVEVPVNVFVIEHSKGLVLFDTGLDIAVKTNPNYVSSIIGRFFLRRLFRLHISTEDTLEPKLKALGYSAADVKTAIISHLHFDHVGGIKDIPQAELLVSEREWQQLSEPHPERDFILREHFDLPTANWKKIKFTPAKESVLEHFSGAYDVMGDGSMILLPTPGHTPGSISLLVREQGISPLLFTGDLSYKAQYLLENRYPGTGDIELLRSSYARVQELRKAMPDLVILPSHDPESEKRLKEAMLAP